MTTPTTIHDDRLALIVDGRVCIEDYEARIVCAELLARRAAARQREEMCKGFWNMCHCSVCMARDKRLEGATPQERQQAAADMMRARGIQP